VFEEERGRSALCSAITPSGGGGGLVRHLVAVDITPCGGEYYAIWRRWIIAPSGGGGLVRHLAALDITPYR